ncbi:MAG TPA: hypothetical protein DCM49_05130 [Lachnospiraceae bacterium]|nr:hypothetical protein [Lachnospiraceae bacterium]
MVFQKAAAGGGKMSLNLDEIMESMLEIVREAGQKSIEMQENEYSWGDYADVDMEIEIFLRERLGSLIPGSGFLTESFISQPSEVANWIIDSIDGNVNFKNRLPYSVSVALEVSGMTEIGIVYELPIGVIYCAQRGKGAYRISKDRRVQIRVSSFPEDEGLVLFGFSYDREKMVPMLQMMEKFASFATDLKRIGPASVDICKVAEGKAKLYVEQDLKEWDYMAGELILKEAGGAVAHYDDFLIFGVIEATAEARRIIRGY